MDLTILLAQTLATALIAAWLTLGLLDNILHPHINGALMAQVLAMTRMRDEFPAEYDAVSHRAITNADPQKRAFQAVIVAESIAVILLWLGGVGLLAATIGLVDTNAARVLALLGTMGFTSIWGGFLIVGNYFNYWLCHEGAQNTHYQMMLWGLGTMILLVVG